MFPILSLTVAIFLGVVAVLALVALVAPAVEPVARTAMKVGQLATLLVVALDVVELLGGREPANYTTHIGYAVAAIGLPVLLLNRRPEGDEEPPPAHLGVVAVTAAAMVVMVVRLQQTL